MSIRQMEIEWSCANSFRPHARAYPPDCTPALAKFDGRQNWVWHCMRMASPTITNLTCEAHRICEPGCAVLPRSTLACNADPMARLSILRTTRITVVEEECNRWWAIAIRLVDKTFWFLGCHTHVCVRRVTRASAVRLWSEIPPRQINKQMTQSNGSNWVNECRNLIVASWKFICHWRACMCSCVRVRVCVCYALRWGRMRMSPSWKSISFYFFSFFVHFIRWTCAFLPHSFCVRAPYQP